MIRSLRSSHLLLGCLALAAPAGCVDDVGFDAADDTELSAEQQELLRWDPQSESLLGAPPTFEWAYANGAGSATAVRSDGTGFTTAPPTWGSGSYLALTGYQPQLGAALDFRVYTASPEGERQRYRVQVRGIASGAFQEYCVNAKTGKTELAYVVPGSFDSAGKYNFLSTRITFLCPGGAAAKSVRWGFAATPRTLMAGAAMARADFCGSSWAHTVTGTTIQFDSVAAPLAGAVTSAGTPPVGEYKLEAAWIAGATDKTAAARALCVKKWRYQSLKPRECELTLPDPRRETEFSTGRFCEDFVDPGTSDADLITELTRQGAIMFSYSLVNDVGIWEWTDAVSGRWLATEQGIYNGTWRGGTTPPPQLPTAAPTPRYLGAVLKYARPDESTPLWLYASNSTPTRYRTTTDDTLDDIQVCPLSWYCYRPWINPRVVGHVLKTGGDQRVRLFTSSRDGLYRLFRAGDDTSGWTFVRNEGYAIH